jgi:predicted RecA/RadA family phage recombinase
MAPRASRAVPFHSRANSILHPEIIMKNYIEEGDKFVYVVPNGTTINAGDFVFAGALCGVSQDTATGVPDGSVSVVVKRTGVFELPKTTGETWAQGDRLFWNSGTSKFTNDSTKTPVHAVAFVAAASSDAIGTLLLSERGGLKVAAGQATTVTASDTIVTGLSKVLACFADLDSAPVVTCDRASASLGDQNGSPVAGSILVQTWMPTSSSVTTPIAATTFGKKVNWVAFGI